MTRLARLDLLLFALLIAHTVDHAVNQPTRDLPATGTAAGLIGFAIVAAAAMLAIRRSPLAPAAAVFAGATTVLGIVAIHLLPTWASAISDPFWEFDANALSWALLIAPLAAAVALALAGARELRARPLPAAG
jgi:hypothetical protein